MGDRANCMVIAADDTAPVYLYTHWTGWELGLDVATALDSKAGRGRWTDPEYLTRILACQILARQGDSALTGETGFGIGTRLTDNEYAILVVDTVHQEVRLHPEGAELDRSAALQTFAFADVAEDPERFSTFWRAVKNDEPLDGLMPGAAV